MKAIGISISLGLEKAFLNIKLIDCFADAEIKLQNELLPVIYND